ncbi:hypothetical protein DIURU_004638 [Diutina rugosa]|uniref:BTB domain-containing protein n=1 Tax=Diutina rugosa TaxID=5481 RepID=A0A642UKU2_DIURU|nr:uncharacterized protein DIURU_004638 [Diutina rugosa]KAA8898618.1 hypothetical protein DIURU_004638 [Diutina rugosa]
MATTTTSSGCYSLALPPTESDDRLNLSVRTGCASTLYHSSVIVHGGLTLGLELVDFTIDEVMSMFAAKVDQSHMRCKELESFLSGEMFHLNLLERQWQRVAIADGEPKPQPRLFHETTAINNCAYIFGGLIIGPSGYLEPTNDLWQFDLETLTWKCLHDGAGWETNPLIPKPRYHHKSTSISSLPFVGASDHFGIFVAGGKDCNSAPLFDNHCFDLVDMCYRGHDPLYLKLTTGKPERDAQLGLDLATAVDEQADVNIDYTTSVIVGIDEDDLMPHHHHHHPKTIIPSSASVASSQHHHHQHRHPSLIVYTPSKQPEPDASFNPLVSFHLGKHIHHGKPLPLHTARRQLKPQDAQASIATGASGRSHTANVPYNLRYPTGGLFGQNLVIVGFMPGDIDISVFIYNRPTGRNAFDRYGDMVSDFELVSCQGDRVPVSLKVLTERWGRYFIQLLARGYVTAVDRFESERQLELAQGQSRLRSLKGGSLSSSQKTKSSIASGSTDNMIEKPSSVGSAAGSSSSGVSGGGSSPTMKPFHFSIPVPSMNNAKPKEMPQFRLPFQDSSSAPVSTSDLNAHDDGPGPASVSASRRNSQASQQSGASSLWTSHLQDIPPQLAQPQEPLPAVPATPTSWRPSSRKNSAADGYNSPRGSLLHTLTALRNIPASRSPRDSPFASPRASISLHSSATPPTGSAPEQLTSTSVPNLKPPPVTPRRTSSSDSMAAADSRKWTSLSSSVSSADYTTFERNESEATTEEPASLLLFDSEDDFRMEASLIPRKLYMPFSSASVKSFCEYLYTGQVGNKWAFWPVSMDILCIARFYKVPLLYDLVSEVLFGIIGHKESWVLKQARKLKRRYLKLAEEVGVVPSIDFATDEYEGFFDTIDDGYTDIALLKKNSRVNRPRSKSEGTYTGSEEIQSADSNNSSSDVEDEHNMYGLSYLQTNDFAHQMSSNPRSRSVFDHSSVAIGLSGGDDADGTMQGIITQSLESLISPDSDVPADIIIETIYEVSTIVLDIKLSLRSRNCCEMARKLKETKEMVEPEIERLLQKKRHQDRAKVRQTMKRQASSATAASIDSNGASVGGELVAGGKSSSDLKHEPSSTSLFNLAKLKNSGDISGSGGAATSKRLGPFSFMSRPQQQPERAQTELSDAISVSTSTSKKHHGIFHIGGSRLKRGNTMDNAQGLPAPMTRTESQSTTSSAKDDKKRKGIFGFKM